MRIVGSYHGTILQNKNSDNLLAILKPALYLVCISGCTHNAKRYSIEILCISSS